MSARLCWNGGALNTLCVFTAECFWSDSIRETGIWWLILKRMKSHVTHRTARVIQMHPQNRQQPKSQSQHQVELDRERADSKNCSGKNNVYHKLFTIEPIVVAIVLHFEQTPPYRSSGYKQHTRLAVSIRRLPSLDYQPNTFAGCAAHLILRSWNSTL